MPDLNKIMADVSEPPADEAIPVTDTDETESGDAGSETTEA